MPYVQSMITGCSSPGCTLSCSSVLSQFSNYTKKPFLGGYSAPIKGYGFATPPCTETTCNNQNLNLLASNLVSTGPISIMVTAKKWSDYVGGILTAAACPSTSGTLDHVVQLVGYNVSGGYWIVRNQWSTDWGEKGYIRLQFDNNTCGLANVATFPILGNSSIFFP